MTGRCPILSKFDCHTVFTRLRCLLKARSVGVTIDDGPGGGVGPSKYASFCRLAAV
jgi:hypothetical protein